MLCTSPDFIFGFLTFPACSMAENVLKEYASHGKYKINYKYFA
jgi:hypothetical protein